MKQQKAATSQGAVKRKSTSAASSRPSASDMQEIASTARYDEMVRQTAYYLYEARDRVDGHELEDWLQAEAQVSQQLSPQSA